MARAGHRQGAEDRPPPPDLHRGTAARLRGHRRQVTHPARTIAGYRVTFRLGPKVERERFAALDEALIAVEAKLRSIGTPHRETRSFLGRDFEPGQQVALRAEVKGPRGLRAGIDMRGDGSTEAWTGRVGRRVVAQEPGEDVYAALRRVSWPA